MTTPYRVAVCLSGQARTWRFCVDSIKRFFSRADHPVTWQPVQWDYFIHTWDTNSYRPNTRITEFTDEPLPAEDFDLIKQKYNPISIEIENWKQFQTATNTTRSYDGMFYSFMKTMMMKRQHEFDNNFEYDFVIKARLDTIYNPYQSFIVHDTDAMILYSCTPVNRFPQEFRYNNFDDVVFYGDSRTMDLAAGVYNLHRQKRLNEQQQILDMNQDPEFLYGPGCMLYKNLIDMAIHPTCFNSFPWYVVRRNVAESNLDPIGDWEQVMKLCMDWYRT